MSAARYGFRVVGALSERRRLVEWSAAFAAHCAADPRAEPECESYLSLFTFGDEFRDYLTRTGSTRDYRGPASMPYLTFDLDCEDLDVALTDARKLAAGLLSAYWRLDDDHALIFFSGRKGFHVSIPMPAGIEPTPDVPAVARFLAERWAAHCGIRIDGGIYDASRCFRSPNSRHPKSGRFKRRIDYGELLNLSAARIVELAGEPLAFDPPANVPDNPGLRHDWEQAAKGVALDRQEKAARYPAGAVAKLAKKTRALIRGEWTPDTGDRHRLLFSAAANLGECHCPESLALELLSEPGFNCSLSAADVQRQIKCGVAHGASEPSRGNEGTQQERNPTCTQTILPPRT